MDLPPMGGLALAGTLVDDEERCVLATALGCPVRSVGEGDDEWLSAVCVPDRNVARRIGVIMGLPWRAEPPAVRLPDSVADVSVAQHYGAVEADEIGMLRCWWVPETPGGPATRMVTPTDELLDDGSWCRPGFDFRGRA